MYVWPASLRPERHVHCHWISKHLLNKHSCRAWHSLPLFMSFHLHPAFHERFYQWIYWIHDVIPLLTAATTELSFIDFRYSSLPCNEDFDWLLDVTHVSIGSVREMWENNQSIEVYEFCSDAVKHWCCECFIEPLIFTGNRHSITSANRE